MSDRRIETRSSKTADFTCFARGCATREKDPRIQGPDYMAELLFPPFARFILNVSPLRKFFLRRMYPAGMYEYILARTKVMDEAFLEAIEARIPQIVLLGAGFDTRAERFAARNNGTKIFEMDISTTQQAKTETFQKRKIQVPPELVFVPIDFDREDILTALAKAGFQSGQKCLFLWEGVTMYLTPQAVDDTLNFIRQHAASGSRIVFDYIYASVLRQENRLFGEKGAYESVARYGESWSFGLEDGEIGSFLGKRGFVVVAHYTPQELEQRYLTGEDGTRHGRVNGTHCIVVASVK